MSPRDRLPQTELRARLADHAERLVAHRARKDHVEMTLRLLELFQRKAFFGKCCAVRDRVGDLDRVGEFAIALLGIERVGDAPLRLPALRAAEPVGDDHGDHIRDRTDTGHHKDDESPRRRAAGSYRMDDERHVEDHEENDKRHGGSGEMLRRAAQSHAACLLNSAIRAAKGSTAA